MTGTGRGTETEKGIGIGSATGTGTGTGIGTGTTGTGTTEDGTTGVVQGLENVASVTDQYPRHELLHQKRNQRLRL